MSKGIGEGDEEGRPGASWTFSHERSRGSRDVVGGLQRRQCARSGPRAYADCELPRDRPAPTLALTAYRMSATIILPGSASPVPRAPHSGAKPCLAATLVYLGMGDRERAIDHLERAYAAN